MASLNAVLLILRTWLFVGDLDDVRKVADGNGPQNIAHVLCLCPEHLQEASGDQEMLSRPQFSMQRCTLHGFDSMVLRNHAFRFFSAMCAYSANPRQQLADQRVDFRSRRAHDSDNYNILAEDLTEARSMASDARSQGGALLVQCWGGCNRAPSIAVALLMLEAKLNLVEACLQVMRNRGEILTNRAFRRQLVKLAAQEDCLPWYGDWWDVPQQEPGVYRWDTSSAEELLTLCYVATRAGMYSDYLDSALRTLSACVAGATASRQWEQLRMLVERRFLLASIMDMG